MNEHEIDDRDLSPGDPAEPASFQHPNPALCPECLGACVLPSGEICPVCEGSGKATNRTGGG